MSHFFLFLRVAGVLLFPLVAACGLRSTPERSHLSSITAPPAADSGFTVRRVADGVFAVTRNEPLGLINESNSLFIIGDKDVVVVDAQSSSARTRETLAALRRLTNKPVSTLINTHWHDDHVVGNEVYADSFPGLAIVGHETSAADMATMGVAFRKGVESRAETIGFLRDLVAKKQSFLGGDIDAEEARSHQLSAWLTEDYSNASSTFLPLTPTVTVRDRLEIRQGRRVIQVLFLGKGHSRGDIVVFLPGERILAAGDLLMWPIQFVGSTSFPSEFAVTQDRLRALPARVVLPGHGKLLSGAEANTHSNRVSRMLRSVSDQTALAVAEGLSLEETRKKIDLSQARRELVGTSRLREILFGYYVAGSAVTRAYALARPDTGRLSFGAGHGQEVINGFAPRTYVAANGMTLPYRLFVPDSGARSQPLPLIIYLHGGGGAGTDNVKQISGGNTLGTQTWTSADMQARHPSFVVAPQLPDDNQWSAPEIDAPAPYAQLVIELLAALSKEFALDQDRIYLTGQSRGGRGTWDLVSKRPDLFAAAVPVCGDGNSSRVLAARGVPIWAFHGAKDEVIPVAGSRELIGALRSVASPIRYTEYPDAGHNVWTLAFAEKDLPSWLFAQRRTRR